MSSYQLKQGNVYILYYDFKVVGINMGPSAVFVSRSFMESGPEAERVLGEWLNKFYLVTAFEIVEQRMV